MMLQYGSLQINCTDLRGLNGMTAFTELTEMCERGDCYVHAFWQTAAAI